MRPNPTEMLGRIREVLAEVVLPELGPGYARSQLQFLLLALDDVAKMEDLYPRLLDENDDLKDLLGAVADSRRKNPRILEVSETVLRETREPAGRPSLREVEARNGRLRGALERTIELLSSEDDTAVAAIRTRIREHLKKYLHRDANMGVMVADRK